MADESILGYAAKEQGARLEPFQYTLPALKEGDVKISITHCGVCYTDIQGIDNYYGIVNYPFVPGHEIVGRIIELGRDVKDLKVGDQVAVGWQGRSCNHCKWCRNGEENLCQDIENCATWDPYGGFSSAIVVDSNFAYRIPEGMASEDAAVLMCAGISVYAPLKKYATEDSTSVGVIGIGGLGHLAIQFARALGCKVTAFSSSPEKENEAAEFGAENFLNINDQSQLDRARGSLDLLLYTSHGKGDWTSLLDCLTTRGRLIVIGFSDEPVTFEPLELVVNQLSITGSLIGSRESMREMLTFAHQQRIKPKIELLPMSRANDALQRLKENKARYRIVLVREPEGS